MGSFNETCALSNMNIAPGDPVKLLFLTRNPYVASDQREDHRGCYHTDQWFVRTPPISGKYDDYGRCAFDEGPITELICKLFQTDVIERPFGFNQYHTGDVTKTKGIHHFIHAAWQGRLLVEDDPTRYDDKLTGLAPPDSWPTWRKVHELLKAAKLPIQLESDAEEGCKGYNAQPVIPGVVCVTFNDYGDSKKRHDKAIKVLSPEYDCKIVQMFPDRADYETCVLVVPKGAFDDPKLLFVEERVVWALTHHPKQDRGRRRLPVLNVMIRQDVWDAYASVDVPKKFAGESEWDKLKSLKWFHDEMTKKFNLKEKYTDKLEKMLHYEDMNYRDVLTTIPFQTTTASHLAAAPFDFPAKDELLRGCAELARIEMVMSRLHQPWYIPPLGGQEGAWALQVAVRSKLLSIAKDVRDEEHEEYEKYK